MGIDILEEGGVITLIGTVPSKEDLEKVEDIALGQESVVKVIDIAALLRY